MRMTHHKILYVSTACSASTFDRILQAADRKPQQQAQKFHRLLIAGLVKCCSEVEAVSRPPIHHAKFAPVGCEHTEGVTYRYLRLLPLPIIRQAFLAIASFTRTVLWRLRSIGEKGAVVADALNTSIFLGSFVAAKMSRSSVVVIVTDLPEFMRPSTDPNFGWRTSTWLSHRLLHSADAYILLTEQMNAKVNPKRRPYVVIEGIADSKMREHIRVPIEFRERVILYSGALFERYGVKRLLDAFALLKDENLRLDLYGAGELVQEIHRAAKKDARIRYHGVVPNSEVVAAQSAATLLINPRPSDEEFTKYSFPSKNIEYMASGTPVVTTCLPGMPAEYRNHVYLLEDESVQGIASSIHRILRLPRADLVDKGTKARDFVLTTKSEESQARKVLALLDRI